MKYLEGKIIIALTGGVLFNGNKTLNTNVSQQGTDAAMLMATDAGRENAFLTNQIDLQTKPVPGSYFTTQDTKIRKKSWDKLYIVFMVLQEYGPS